MKISGEHAAMWQDHNGRLNKTSVSTNTTRQADGSVAPAPGSDSEFGRLLGQVNNKGKGSESIADIMSGVSLRHIRYTDLVSIAGKLRDAGHLAEKDYLDFIGPSPEYAMLDGSTNPDWNLPTDVIGRHQMNLDFMLATGAEQRFIDFERHLLALYRKFEV